MSETSSVKASIGADYSGSAAYIAICKGRELVASNEFRMMDRPWGFKHEIQQWLEDAKIFSHPELWIEDQLPSARRITGGMQLVRVKTFLEIAALDAGLEPCFAHPGTWRKRVYGNGRPDDPKERARQVAKEIFGYETRFKNQHNICEGMLIAFYGQLQHNPEFHVQLPAVRGSI